MSFRPGSDPSAGGVPTVRLPMLHTAQPVNADLTNFLVAICGVAVHTASAFPRDWWVTAC